MGNGDEMKPNVLPVYGNIWGFDFKMQAGS